jgi:hypothetical protein
MKKQKVLKCVFSKKGKLLRVVPNTKAKSSKQKNEEYIKRYEDIVWASKTWIKEQKKKAYEQGKKEDDKTGTKRTLEEVLKNAEMMLCDDWKNRCKDCNLYPDYCDAYRHYLWLEQKLREMEK